MRIDKNAWGLIVLFLFTLSAAAPLQVCSAANTETANHTVIQLKNELSTYQQGKNYNLIIDGHGTGLIPPTEEEWNQLAQAFSAAEFSPQNVQNLPSSVDQSATQWFPPIGDQAHQGSCAAWAVGYYIKTFQEAKEHNWNLTNAKWEESQPSSSYQDKIISPAFIYNLLNGGEDNGLNFEEPITLICQVGAASWKNMPYTDKNCTAWPSEAAWTEAAQYRSDSSGYKFLDVDSSEGLTNLKSLLFNGNLAVTAVDAYKFQNLTDNDVLVADKYVNLSLNHAATIVGYDDNIAYVEDGQVHYGAFKVANSWGIGQVHANMTSWEHVQDGCYWISYETMKRQVGWCMYYNDCSNYQPSLLAKFCIDHSVRSEVSITVGLGTPDAPVATKVFCESKVYSDTSLGLVFGGNHSFCSNNIVLDISEFTAYPHSLYSQPFFLKVHDCGTAATGNVTYFSIGNSSCQAVPVQTEQFENVYLTVNYTEAVPSIVVSQISSVHWNRVVINGYGFNVGSSITLSYLNPVTSSWVIVSDNFTLAASNFIYGFNLPNSLSANLSISQSLSDTITFKAQDNTSGYCCNASLFYIWWR